MAYEIDFSPAAEAHLNFYFSFYEGKVPGLGLRFHTLVDNHLLTLKTVPYMHVRYDEIRCVPVLGFPFMLHYSVIADKNLVRVHALIHTSRNPSENWNKDDWQVSEEMPMYGAHTYDLEYYYAA